MTFRPPVFSVKDNPRYWKNYLYNEGYVVLDDILTENQQVDLFTTFKNDLKQVSPNFDFDNKETWTIENTPIMFGKGMALYNGLGQSDFMWKLRTHKNIQYPFQTLFGTQHLVSSLDGFSLFVSDKQKPKSWLHIDQNPLNNAYSVQAAYNLFPVESDDAGFVVVPKSHKTFKPIPRNKADWIVVDQDLFNPKALKLLIPKNCLTIWNSRLVHANSGIVKTKNTAVNEKINRLTAYITFLPKSSFINLERVSEKIVLLIL